MLRWVSGFGYVDFRFKTAARRLKCQIWATFDTFDPVKIREGMGETPKSKRRQATVAPAGNFLFPIFLLHFETRARRERLISKICAKFRTF